MLNATGNAVAAKTRCMYGKRLTNNDYAELMRCKRVTDIAAYLKTGTHYSDALRSINENDIHRGRLETLLRRAAEQEFEKLYRYKSPAGEMFMFYIMDAEIRTILKCSSAVNAEDFLQMIAQLPVFIKEHTSFDIMKLGTVKNTEDLKNVLQDTKYCDAVAEYHEKNDYSLFENRLKNLYYNSLTEYIKTHFRGNTQKQLLEIVFAEIDLYNMTLIFRLKFLYGFDNRKITALMLPRDSIGSIRSNLRKVNALLETDDKDTFIRKLGAMYHLDDSLLRDMKKDYYIELISKKILYNVNIKYLRFSTDPAVTYFSYIALSRIEVDNIVTIIECVRYMIPAQNIKPLVIGI